MSDVKDVPGSVGRDIPALGDGGLDAGAEYYYRRPLRLRELLPAVAVAVGAGLFAFYVTRLLLQRTPLKVERSGGTPDGARRTRSRGGADIRERSARS